MSFLYFTCVKILHKHLQLYSIINFSLPSFVIQKKADMSRVSVEFIVNTERSVCHATDAFPAK